MMRYLAPVGTPISLNDLKNWSYNLVASNDILEKFRSAICNKYGVKHCFFVSSGRTALYLLLQSFSELTAGSRDEVVITSYNSCSVPSAVIKAGLQIRICDIDINTLDYDHQKLSGIDFSKVLCIVSSNLYGIPNNLVKLERIAKEHGVFLIDDAAQCMGGRSGGKFSGTFGDAGLFSLGMGKNITSVEGGIIVTKSDNMASLIKVKTASLPAMSLAGKISCIVRLLAYTALLHPNLCGIPAHTKSLSMERYTAEFSIHSYNKLLGAMGFQLFKRINMIENTRIKNALYLREHLDNVPFIKFIQYNNDTKPVFLRFPVVIENEAIRNVLVDRLNKNGIWTTRAYPVSILDVPEIKNNIIGKANDAEIGRLVAEQLVTLPTHSYVTEDDLDEIASIIKSTKGNDLGSS